MKASTALITSECLKMSCLIILSKQHHCLNLFLTSTSVSLTKSCLCNALECLIYKGECLTHSVSADKWPVTRANEQQRKCKGNIFMLSCYKEWALKLIFSYTFGDSSMLQCRDNCFSEFKAIQQASMVHANIYCAHHSISCGTCKHSLCTPYHIILHCIHKTFIMDTIAYCIARARHSFDTPVYKTWLVLEICHSCVRFLLPVLSISLRRVVRGMWVPQTNSIANTNQTWHSALCTQRYTLGVHVGIQVQSVE